MKKIYLFLALMLILPFSAQAEDATIRGLEQFNNQSGYITQRVGSTPIKLTGYGDGCVYLAGGILTINTGNVICSGGGGGGSGSGTVSTSTALTSGQVDFSTGVSTIGNDSNFLWDNTLKQLTATKAVFTTATATSATTTNFAISSLLSKILSTNANGTLQALTVSSPLTFLSNALGCQAASGSQAGCLSAADWTTFNGKGSGTVTAVSVASANGFAGSSSGGSTPALTLSTTITGLLKGNGTAISAASSGSDYAPATSGSSLLYGNGSGGFSNATIGAGISFTGGTLSSTGGSSSGNVATSTGETAGQIAYWTSTNGTPAKLGSVATSSLVQSTGINIANGTTAYVIGAQPTFTVDQAFSPTWTGAHIFDNITRSTTTQATTTSLYVSGNASTTQFFGSNLHQCNSASNAITWNAGVFGCNTISAGSSASSTLLSDNNGFTGVNTFSDLIATRATTTQATTTSLYVSGNASTSALYLATGACSGANALNLSAAGKVICGTVSGAGSASSTLLQDKNGFTGVNTFSDLIATRATTTEATTTTASFTNASSTKLVSASIFVPEKVLATSTSMTINFPSASQSNNVQQLVRLGTSATTITLGNITPGANLRLLVCNPGTTAGALTWAPAASFLWAGGTIPAQTTAADKCDTWNFIATNATSTTKIFGGANLSF